MKYINISNLIIKISIFNILKPNEPIKIENLGNTCYIAAIYQLLVLIPAFRNHILDILKNKQSNSINAARLLFLNNSEEFCTKQ